MSINELQDEVIAEFSDFDDWMDKNTLKAVGQTVLEVIYNEK